MTAFRFNKSFLKKVALLGSILLVEVLNNPANATTLNPPPDELNLLVMLENQTQDIATMQYLFGLDPDSSFSWNGSFSNTGWNLNTTGTYFNRPVNINYTGVYNLAGTIDPTYDVVTWSLSGNALDDLSISGDGSATVINSWLWNSSTFWRLAGVLVATVTVAATEVFIPPTAAFSPLAYNVIRVASLLVLSGTNSTLGGAEPSSTTTITPNPNDNPDSNNIPATKKPFVVASNGSRVGNNVTGETTVAQIPEPSSILSLLALGTLGAASTLKRKLKPSQLTEKETTKVS